MIRFWLWCIVVVVYGGGNGGGVDGCDGVMLVLMVRAVAVWW